MRVSNKLLAEALKLPPGVSIKLAGPGQPGVTLFQIEAKDVKLAVTDVWPIYGWLVRDDGKEEWFFKEWGTGE